MRWMNCAVLETCPEWTGAWGSGSSCLVRRGARRHRLSRVVPGWGLAVQCFRMVMLMVLVSASRE